MLGIFLRLEIFFLLSEFELRWDLRLGVQFRLQNREGEYLGFPWNYGQLSDSKGARIRICHTRSHRRAYIERGEQKSSSVYLWRIRLPLTITHGQMGPFFVRLKSDKRPGEAED